MKMTEIPSLTFTILAALVVLRLSATVAIFPQTDRGPMPTLKPGTNQLHTVTCDRKYRPKNARSDQ